MLHFLYMNDDDIIDERDLIIEMRKIDNVKVKNGLCNTRK